MPSPPESYAQARTLIDSAHAADPSDSELPYADSLEAWTSLLSPSASPLLLLAARCQHLERFLTPRKSYPEGRTGYLQWRRGLYKTQGARAKALLLEAGVETTEAEAVERWVAKTGIQGVGGGKAEAETQVLEDAAVLVFLEEQLEKYREEHEEITEERWEQILGKSWRKLSPRGKECAVERVVPKLGEGVRAVVLSAVGKAEMRREETDPRVGKEEGRIGPEE